MSRRKIAMLEISEVFYHWQKGQSRSHISKSLGISRPTIAKYLSMAIEYGLEREYNPQATVKALEAISKARIPSYISTGKAQKCIAIFDEWIRLWLSDPNITVKQIVHMLNERNNDFSYSSIYRYTTKIKAETQDRENKCYNINQLKDLIAISNKNSALEEYKLWFFETSARQN